MALIKWIKYWVQGEDPMETPTLRRPYLIPDFIGTPQQLMDKIILSHQAIPATANFHLLYSIEGDGEGWLRLLDVAELPPQPKVWVHTVHTAALVQVSAQITPPKQDLIKLLKAMKLQRGLTRDQVVDWVKWLPISDSTKHFLESNLRSVADEMYVKATLGGMADLPCVVRRLDYKQVLEQESQAKLLILNGIRRQGKTCALPMELVHARSEKFGVQDKAIFYHAGEENMLGDLRPSSLNMAILVLVYAGIAACWDEFQFSVEDLGRAYKFLLEQAEVDVDPLSVVIWGSSEPQVQDKAGTLVSGLRSRGSYHFHLPDPSIEVLVGVYYLSKGLYKKEVSSSELLEAWNSEEFLQRLTVCGYNLEAHIALGSKEVGLEDYEGRLGCGINGYGRYGSALMGLILNGGDCKDVSLEDLLILERRNYVKKDPQNSKRVDFMHPEVIMYSTLKTHDALTMESCADADGRVFEVLVRGKHLLLPQLLRVIAEKGQLNDKIKDLDMGKFLAKAENMRYGSFGKKCEIDGFFSFETVLTVLSMKRSMGSQDMVQVIKELEDLRKIILSNRPGKWPGWELLDAGTESIFIVEVSAIEDRPTKATSVTEFHGKPMTRISVTLKELVKHISPRLIRLSKAA